MPGRPWCWWWDLSAVGPVVQCSTLLSSCLALLQQSLECRTWRSCPSVWTNQRRAELAAVAVAAAAAPSQVVCSLLYKPISARRRAFTRLTLLGKWVQQIETCSSSSETEREQCLASFWAQVSLTHSLWLTTLQTRNRSPPQIWERNKQLAKTPETAKKEIFFCFKERKKFSLTQQTFPQRTNISKPAGRTCRVVDQEFKADFLETISGTKLRANEENKLEKYLIHRPRVQNFSNKQTPMLTLIK